MQSVTSKEFSIGTTGWTIDDLENPEFEAAWETGHYEIVEGVLTQMPAAMLDGAGPLARLTRIIERHLDATKTDGYFAYEIDFVVDRKRVARADMMFVTPDLERRQQIANKERGGRAARFRFGRVLVPPPLVVESISVGHEDHDRETKRAWYAAAQVPHYWILDAFQQSLDCLVLDGDAYRVEQAGEKDAEVRPSFFPGLVIPLRALWL